MKTSGNQGPSGGLTGSPPAGRYMRQGGLARSLGHQNSIIYASNEPSQVQYKCWLLFIHFPIEIIRWMDVVRNSCPGAGACGGMYTANTVASAIMGMSLPYCSSTPAEDPLKLIECRLAGKYLLDLLKMDLRPQEIITQKSLRNAMVIVMALGGSTNAVLHLFAIARSVGLDLTLEDFQKVSDAVPFLADLKPSGKYVVEDVHKGIPKFLLQSTARKLERRRMKPRERLRRSNLDA